MGESRGGEGRKATSEPTTGLTDILGELWEAPSVMWLDPPGQMLVECPCCGSVATVSNDAYRIAVERLEYVRSLANREK